MNISVRLFRSVFVWKFIGGRIDFTRDKRRSLQRFLLEGLLCCVGLCIAGCGHGDRPPLGLVQGVVKLGDKPLVNAGVTFFPEGKGRPSCGKTDEDGHYTLTYLRDIKGAIVGRHKVVIETASPDEYGKEVVPARYNRNTTLDKEVAAGTNEINFDLATK